MVFDKLLGKPLIHDHTSELDGTYVNVTGDTMTGQLNITGADLKVGNFNDTNRSIVFDAAAGYNAVLSFYSGGGLIGQIGRFGGSSDIQMYSHDTFETFMTFDMSLSGIVMHKNGTNDSTNIKFKNTQAGGRADILWHNDHDQPVAKISCHDSDDATSDQTHWQVYITKADKTTWLSVFDIDAQTDNPLSTFISSVEIENNFTAPGLRIQQDSNQPALKIENNGTGYTIDGGTFYVQADGFIGNFSTAPQLQIGTDTSNYMKFRKRSGVGGELQIVQQTGGALFDVDPIPSDGTSASQFRYFRNVTTTGTRSLSFYLGDGTSTLSHFLNMNGNSALCIPASDKLGIGDETPSYKLDVAGDGQFTTDLRVNVSTTGLGLRVGSTTNASHYMEFRPTTGHAIGYNEEGMLVQAGADKDVIFKTGSATWNAGTEQMRVDAATAAVGIGVGSPTGKLHVNQSSTTGAKPVITLDQGDVSEEFIRLIGTSTTDATQSLVDAADLTTPGSIVGWFKVYIQDGQGTGPITDGVYYVPFYTAPTA